MRRSFRLAAAVVSLAAFTVVAAVPAEAQEPLGFTVDATQGLSGEVVGGQVDAADVAAGCTTDLGAFQARFHELQTLMSDPSVFGGRFFETTPWQESVYDDYDQLAYALVLLAAYGIEQNVNGAAEDALPQSFVMTFADIATQEPVGDLGRFDAGTGVGSAVVPDVEPGLWAVAAACVGPPVDDLDMLEAGIREGGAFLEELGAPFGPEGALSDEFYEFARAYVGNDVSGVDVLLEFVSEIGPDLLEPIMVPDALGLQLFRVLADPGDLIAEIEGLVAEGDLAAGYARGLVKPLENAARSLENGDTESACDQLDGVSDRDIPENVLDPEAAGELIAGIEALEAHLGCA